MPRLFLIRHGQSVWNRQRRFSGWGDPPLSPAGREQAREAGRLLAAAEANPGAVFCSRLTRARRTLDLALAAWGDVLPTVATFSWRLNERHCGQWEGQRKSEIEDGRLAPWRDEPAVRPPLLEPGDPRHPRHAPRYQDIDPALLPAGESYLDLLSRLRPLWRDELAPALAQGGCVWVVAHSGSLWGLTGLLYERLGLPLPLWSLPPADPLCLELDRDLLPRAAGFLDRRGDEPPHRPPLPSLRPD